MKRWWFGSLLVAANFAFTAIVYSRLPERIPTHWGLSGAPDGWSDRWPWAFMPAAISLLMWLATGLLPRVGPRKDNLERSSDAWWIVVNTTLVFFCLLTVATLGASLGWAVDVTRVMLGGVGLLLAVVGNYLPRIRSNWWMGIRTPWTLENETVWRETHRVGGWTFVAAGLALVVAGLLVPAGPREWVSGAAVAIGVVVPLVYSYLAYRRVGAGGEGAEARQG